MRYVINWNLPSLIAAKTEICVRECTKGWLQGQHQVNMIILKLSSPFAAWGKLCFLRDWGTWCLLLHLICEMLVCVRLYIGIRGWGLQPLQLGANESRVNICNLLLYLTWYPRSKDNKWIMEFWTIWADFILFTIEIFFYYLDFM